MHFLPRLEPKPVFPVCSYFLESAAVCGSPVEDKVPLNFTYRGTRQTDRGRGFEWAPQASVCPSWKYRPRIYRLTEHITIESFYISSYLWTGKILRYLRVAECCSQVTRIPALYSGSFGFRS
jgi:hypothetical protein